MWIWNCRNKIGQINFDIRYWYSLEVLNMGKYFEIHNKREDCQESLCVGFFPVELYEHKTIQVLAIKIWARGENGNFQLSIFPLSLSI